MAELACQPDAAAREVEVLDAAGVRSMNPAISGEVAGGLLCRRDAVVEPGQVLGALRRQMSGGDGYEWIAGTRVVEVTEGRVSDHCGRVHHGDRIVLCIGDQLSGIGGAVGADLAVAPIRRCRLQMMQTSPDPERLTTASRSAIPTSTTSPSTSPSRRPPTTICAPERSESSDGRFRPSSGDGRVSTRS
jgi:hypothetical protein